MFNFWKKDSQEMLDYVEFSITKLTRLYEEIDKLDKETITESFKKHKGTIFQDVKTTPEEFWDIYFRYREKFLYVKDNFKKIQEIDEQLPPHEREFLRDKIYDSLKRVHKVVKELRQESEDMADVFNHLAGKYSHCNHQGTTDELHLCSRRD